MRFNRQQPPAKPLVTSSAPSKDTAKPFRSGYEAYKNSSYMPDLQVDATLWGNNPQKAQPAYTSSAQHQRSSHPVTAKKMMTLEEIEAGLYSQPERSDPSPSFQEQSSVRPLPSIQQGLPQTGGPTAQQPLNIQAPPISILQHPGQRPSDPSLARLQSQQRPRSDVGHHGSEFSGIELPTNVTPAAQVVSAFPPPYASQVLKPERTSSRGDVDARISPQPRQILQNPNRQPMLQASRDEVSLESAQSETRGIMTNQNNTAASLPIITHPSQLAQLTKEQRQAFLIEDAKRAKRNHKIYLLSKDNGLMTPQDKNFITRIQLQQLMTATSNANEQDPDARLAEDFYYQVYNQIENRPRQNPHQPLSNFAQTYLFQTGGRHGNVGRRHNRGGDNHMNRMQQQVQRAVEAAKLKPKNKQLVIEGSLGKISFSNAKTPKPLLNIKRNEGSDLTNRPTSKKIPQVALSTTDRKAILKNVEAVYSILMRMEDHDRRIPPRPTIENDSAALEPFLEWRETFHKLNEKLWMDLKVMEPIMPESTVLHPFIAFLSYPKGKKAVPRLFSHIDQEQRLTILTIIMVQLDTLDVVRLTQPRFAPANSSSLAREQVDLFLQAVMPSLFSYVTEAPFNIVIGLLGLVIERTNLQVISRTRVGLEILTMFLSQSEIIRKAEATNEKDWKSWLGIYNRLFDTVEPILADVFPGSVSAGQDVYVWQFLATLGTGANPEQQQRLVLAVKYV